MDRYKIIEKIKTHKGIIDGHSHIGVNYKNYLSYSYPYCLSFEDLVVRMKYLGISYSVIFSMDSSYYTVEPEASKEIKTNEVFSKFPYEIENQSMLKEIYEVFPEYSDMALPFVLFDPSRKTSEQAELLEELHKRYPLFGLKTIPTYIHAFVNDLETKGSPILDFAVRHDLPITFHSSYYKGDPWASVFDIIKFAEKHAEIRICLAHSARFVKSVLERASKLENCFVDLSAFHIHCILAQQKSLAIPPSGERIEADYSDPSSVMDKIVSNYPDTIIWGSDTPYNYFIQKYYDINGNLIDTSLKSSFDMEMKILKNLSEDKISKITYKNTLKYLFG
ncbi:amidohydrolase family protein [bacterium]|nr:amidohydrolase family protein [bacterium]